MRQPSQLLLVLLGIFAIRARSQTPSAASKAATIHNGQLVHYQRCLQCNSIIPGQVMVGPSLYGEMRVLPQKKTATQVRSQIRDGKEKMPPFKDILSTEQINDLIAFLRTL